MTQDEIDNGFDNWLCKKVKAEDWYSLVMSNGEIIKYLRATYKAGAENKHAGEIK